MTQPIYSNSGEEQYLDIRFKFKVKHSPGNRNHLTQLLESFFHSKGIKMEDDSHKIEII
jgi:hypothetical protein